MASELNVVQSDHSFQRYQDELRQCIHVGISKSERPTGIALYGLGRIGLVHFKNLLTIGHCQILYLVEPEKSRAEHLIEKYQLRDTKIVSDPYNLELLNDPRVEAVIVCTPTETHQKVVLNALDAGKSVFCEKPLASTYDGIKLCYESAEKQKKRLMCAFNRRYDPTIAEIEKRSSAGEIGMLSIVKTCSRDSPKPSIEYLKNSGGIFHDCAVHDIDLICWIMKSLPIKVYSSASALKSDIKEIDDFDTVAITLTFPNGAIGIIDISRHATYGYDQRLEVFGSMGMLSSENKSANISMRTEKLSLTGPILYSFASRYHDAYLAEMEEFIHEIKTGFRKSGNEGESTLAVSKIASACEQSARSGSVVNLQWD